MTDAAREAARNAVGPQYDFTVAQAEAIAVQQAQTLGASSCRWTRPSATAWHRRTGRSILKAALSTLSSERTATLQGLTPARWKAVRTEAARVLDTVERTELKDVQVPLVRDNLAGRMAGDLNVDERALAAALIEPLGRGQLDVDPQLTETRRDQEAAAVEPVEKSWEKTTSSPDRAIG